MKKHLLALILSVFVISALLCSCGTEETKTTEAPESQTETQATQEETSTEPATSGQFEVGFARVDIRPTEPQPLAGYGNTLTRMSVGSLDYLYCQCIAMKDEDGQQLLLMVYDVITMNNQLTAILKEAITEATGVPEDHIFFNVSHSHSAPDMGYMDSNAAVSRYFKQQYPKWSAECAKKAIADYAPATIYTGETHTENMNFVRHYLMNDGTYFGDNFGDSSSGIKQHATEVDNQMQFLSFRREGKKEVLCVSYQCHAQFLGRENLDVSADFLAPFRSDVEKAIGNCYCVYLQGACGNINGRSVIETERTIRDQQLYGHDLAPYVTEAYPTLVETPAGKIQTFKEVATVPADHHDDGMIGNAKMVADWCIEHFADSSACYAYARQYGFNSYYHANAVVTKFSRGATTTATYGAFCIGDLGFATVGAELFDTLGMYIKENSPFARTYMIAYSEDMGGYMPSHFAYTTGCYEVDTTRWADGVGETIADDIVAALKSFKK